MTNAADFAFNCEDRLFPQKYSLQVKGRYYSWKEPQLMGVLNVTPDSFFEGSRVQINRDSVLKLASKMIEEGADILDIGGYSSRPGATDISCSEELRRVIDPIQWISQEFPETLLSIDTFRSQVAIQAVQSGAHLVNDISGGKDEEMFSAVAALKVPYFLMHMRGTPQTMQVKTDYEDILLEIMGYFSKKLPILKKVGIKDVIIDPGFGFSKTISQNYILLRNLDVFKTLGLPLLVGLSRKSMIYRLLENKPEDALNGTTALHMVAFQKGANIVRVHDVKQANETRKLYKQLYS